VHLNSPCLDCINIYTQNYAESDKKHGFYQFLTRTLSDSNSNDHLYIELAQTKFKMGTICLMTFWQPINCLYGTPSSSHYTDTYLCHNEPEFTKLENWPLNSLDLNPVD